MTALNTLSSRAFAALSSVAFSLIVFATAIAPANQGALLPLVA